ncbi:hypothetical protein HK099_000238, partial [Clydaea vesicula]
VDYNFHFNRLKLGAEELFNFALTVDDKKKIFFLIKNCIEEFYKQILQIDIPNSSTEIEAKVTILIFKDETENMKIICLCDTFKENKLPYCKILLGGKPRSLPMVKASQWVLDRVKFDDLVVSPIHEVVLMDDSNDIFEGLTSNFCVLTTNDSNFDPQNAVDFSMFTIISAPQDQVLPGSMISLVSSDKPQEILKKFKIGKLEGRNEFPSFPRDTGFYRDLTKKVGDYFKKTNKDPKDPLPGLWLSWNFQVSHVSPIADFYEKEGEIDEWAKVQVRTSIDYAHGNALGTFLCGALNYQIEHHLFPSISQYHYPAIAPIVMEVCKQHNVKYNLLPSFTAAFKLHLHHLYNLGSEPSKVKSH